MRYDWISFTTDYGLTDPYVGICHGVIGRIAPHSTVLDLTHGVPPGDVRHGGFTLAQSVAFLPPAVHLAVVDPGVGTHRRAIALVAADGVLVGPDNGLLPRAADALGGPRQAFELTAAEFRLPWVSATFHGRDVFAPAAAHLACGVAPESFGPEVPLHQLERLPSPAPSVRTGAVVTEVATVDRFGNVQLTAPAQALAEAGFADGDRVVVRLGPGSAEGSGGVVGRTFADVDDGDLIVLGDSAGLVAVAVNGGSAAHRLGLTPGHAAPEVTISAG